MYKDFKFWHNVKSFINNHKERLYFYEKEVWFCSLGNNIGYEQDGKGLQYLRPVIVIKKFNNEVFWALPLTKTIKQGKYYHSLLLRGSVENCAVLSQLRLIDSKRLKYKIDYISTIDFDVIKQKLKLLLE